MKLNFKARLHNKTFVIAISTMIIAFIYDFLSLLDIVPRVSQDAITNTAMMLIKIVFALGIVVDPTTDGIADSDRAMTYFSEDDCNLIESEDVSDEL